MQKKLRALRKYNDITKKEMAEILKIDERTYSNKEGGHSQFKMDEMFEIAQKFEMEINDIFLPTNFMKHEV